MKAASVSIAAGAYPRNLAISGGVVALHLAALWWAQAGLVARMPEKVVEIDMLSEMIEPPKALPVATVPPPALPPRIAQALPPQKFTTPAVAAPRPAPQPAPPNPAPLLTTVVNAPPSPIAPSVDAAAPLPAAALSGPAAQPLASSVTAPAAPPVPPRVELPSTDASYLNNPKPAYPAISRRLGEQGKVLLRVVIAADGSAQKVELQKSSGYERLDQAAINAVQQWRFVPGKRNGIAEAMAHTVPVNFSLE